MLCVTEGAEAQQEPDVILPISTRLLYRAVLEVLSDLGTSFPEFSVMIPEYEVRGIASDIVLRVGQQARR